VRPLAVFDPDFDPLDDDLLPELFDEEEPDLDEPPFFEAPVLRDDVDADLAPPRDEEDVFDPPLLFELPPLLPAALLALDDFEAPLLFDEEVLVPEDEPPREDADDLLPPDFDEPPDEPLFDDDDFAELLLPDDELLLPDDPLLPAVELLPDEDDLLPDDDELLPDDDELLPDDALLRAPPVLPPPVEPLVEASLGATISTAVDAAPTTAPVAAPPRRSVATSATLSMMVLTADVVLEPLDFFEEPEAERFFELDDFPAITILPNVRILNLCSKSKLAHF